MLLMLLSLHLSTFYINDTISEVDFFSFCFSGLDVVGALQSLGVAESLLQSKLAAGAGTFVVAYAVHKVFAPVRIGITLTATPFIVRYLRKIGFLKVPKHVRDSSV